MTSHLHTLHDAVQICSSFLIEESVLTGRSFYLKCAVIFTILSQISVDLGGGHRGDGQLGTWT